MNTTSIRQLTTLSLLVAVAVMLNYFERFIPIVITIPGVRLGLANVVTLICLGLYGYRSAFTVLAMRIVLSATFYGGFSALVYAAAGGGLALLAMALLWPLRDRYVSVVGISVVGAIAHNIGQVTVAFFMLGTTAIFGYLAILLLSAIVTGVLIGVVARRSLIYLMRHQV